MGALTGGLTADSYDRVYSDRELLGRILAAFGSQRRRVILAAVMVITATALTTAIPLVIASTIDAQATQADARGAWLTAALVAGLGGLAWLANYVRLRQASQAVAEVVAALRRDAFAAVVRQDRSFFDSEQSGRIVSRVSGDTQDFAAVVTLSIELISQFSLVLAVSTVLAVIEWRMALLLLLIAPPVILTALAFRRLARVTMQRAQRAMATVNAGIGESLSGIAQAKNFRREADLYRLFQDTNATAYRQQLRRGLVFGSIYPLLNTMNGLATALVLLVGGTLVLDNTVSFGNWYLFLQGLAIFFYPLTSIASFWSQFQQGLAAAERVYALIDREPELVQTAALPADQLRGEIELRDVTFRYQTGSIALDNVSLTIPAGWTVAVVGHTGAGKSSLMKLLARWYEYQSGTILVDGTDLRRFELDAYRRVVGIVPQQPFLFEGTLADNIRYGRPAATDAEVLAAAAVLGEENWLDELPDGLSTAVGERGSRLSLGQRQLAALARVVLQQPKLILLDEATASIDPLTEAQLQRGLAQVLAGRTSLVIAHRLSTVIHADLILVMEHGRIAEQGRHAELLAAGGVYAQLYATYFRHQSADYDVSTARM
jgi:ATP-binding cassette subfamily B protein